MRQSSLHHSLAVLALATVLVAPSARAQLAPGQRIRVKHDRQSIVEGIYLGSDSLRYALVAAGSDTVRIPIAGGYTVQRFVENKSHPVQDVTRGLLVGAGIGGSLVILAGVGPGTEKGPALALAAVLGVVTTATGFLFGTIMAVSNHDVWEAVSLMPDAAMTGTSDATTRERSLTDSTRSP